MVEYILILAANRSVFEFHHFLFNFNIITAYWLIFSRHQFNLYLFFFCYSQNQLLCRRTFFFCILFFTRSQFFLHPFYLRLYIRLRLFLYAKYFFFSSSSAVFDFFLNLYCLAQTISSEKKNKAKIDWRWNKSYSIC